MKVKKGKAAILAVATVALIASLVYDKKTNNKTKEEEREESENTFVVE